MFRVPYRWMWRTVGKNLRHCWWDLVNGLRNLRRWIPIIWYDADFDWEYMATIMEAKLTWMAEDAKRWPTVGADRNRKQMLQCVALLRRLREDDYFERVSKVFDGPAAARSAVAQQRQDQQYLGKMLGSHLASWWA